MKVLLTTGGTGGHVFPCIAVAKVLQSQGVECLFVGTNKGQEKIWAKNAGLNFQGLDVSGVLGRGFKAIRAIFDLSRASIEAIKIIRQFKPDVVVGFGSYASFASLAAASLCRVPIIIHEQNAYAGLTNRILGKLAHKVCLSMEDGAGNFSKDKTVLTGNPVREDIVNAQKSERALASKNLLVLGGSQGAKAINSLILSSLTRLNEQGVNILHQCGKNDYERVKSAYHAFGLAEKHRVQPFVDDMVSAYDFADIVIARAGASTVAEVCAFGKCAVYIPFPYATHDHQTFNANEVCKNGASIMFSEKDFSKNDVIQSILDLLNDKEKLNEMGQKAKKMAKLNAAQDVAKVIIDTIRQKNEK